MKKNIFFASLQSLKKGVESGVGSGSRAGSINQEVRIRGSGSAPKCHGSPTLPSTRLMMILLLVRASIQKNVPATPPWSILFL
jgi:hypothetical protein